MDHADCVNRRDATSWKSKLWTESRNKMPCEPLTVTANKKKFNNFHLNNLI